MIKIKKCSSPDAWHDGSCCCNCEHQKKLKTNRFMKIKEAGQNDKKDIIGDIRIAFQFLKEHNGQYGSLIIRENRLSKEDIDGLEMDGFTIIRYKIWNGLRRIKMLNIKKR